MVVFTFLFIFSLLIPYPAKLAIILKKNKIAIFAQNKIEMKLFTPVPTPHSSVRIHPGNKIALVGSCFADSFAERFISAGFEVLHNPFGTLYNPLSIELALHRLKSGRPFSESDCVKMGAGCGKICSFFHHTTFARDDSNAFLDNANKKLEEAHEAWESVSTVVVTLGTAWVWKHAGNVVSNCLKRPGTEFSHELMSPEDVRDCILRMKDECPDKEFIFTISPVRHRNSHENILGKSSLFLGLEGTSVCYFPSYEILMDELRDYRFYAQDMIHPSQTAMDIIWERFLDATTDKDDRALIEENTRAAAHRAHRPILKD